MCDMIIRSGTERLIGILIKQREKALKRKVCPKCKENYNYCDCICFEEDYIKAGLPWLAYAKK